MTEPAHPATGAPDSAPASGTRPQPTDLAGSSGGRASAASLAPAAGTGLSEGESTSGLLRRYPNALWIGAAIALAAALFYLLAPILTPFALAGVLAYVLLPGVAWLERRGLARPIASVVMVVLSAAAMLGLLLILVPVLEREALALDQKFPAFVAQANATLTPLFKQWLGVTVRLDAPALRALAIQQVGQQDVLSALLSRFGSGGLALLEALGTLALVPIVLFYLLLDAPAFAQRCEAAVPRRWQAQLMRLLGEIDAVLAQFLRGQVTVMLLLAVYYSSALSIAGFDSALPIGVLTGLLIFIPYVGFALGLLLAAMVALLQFGTWQSGLVVLLVYGIGQVLEGFFLTPRLVGGRIGLPPLAVIFALLAFGHVFGFFGVLVALPSSAVLLVALRHLRRAYLASRFYLGS